MKEALISDSTSTHTSSYINKYSYQNKDPMVETSALGRFFFSWAFRIIALSRKALLKAEYLGVLNPSAKSKTFFTNISDVWDKKRYKFKRTYPLLLTSLRTNLQAIIFIILCTLMNSILSILSIYFFRIYIKMFRDTSETTSKHIYIGSCYLLIRLVDFIGQRKNGELLTFIGNKSAVELKCLVYDKLLKLSPTVEINSGAICNYIQNDSYKLSKLMESCPNIGTVPFGIIMYNYLLFKYMGISFLFGFGVMIIFLFINYHFRKKFSQYLKLHMKKSDQRMKVVTETFNNLKVIKLYGWDDIFGPRINNARDDELDALNKRYQITQISQTLLWLAPVAMSVTAIGAYQYFNETFAIEDMFTCLGIFTSIQIPMKNLPVTFDNILETLVSLGRIEKYLKNAEINKRTITRNDSTTMKNNIAIKIENGMYTWGNLNKDNEAKQSPSKPAPVEKKNKPDDIVELIDYTLKKDNSGSKSVATTALYEEDNLKEEIVTQYEQETSTLKNINLEIKKGEFVCIIGEVGSGKSSILQAILNNMTSTTPRKTKGIINGTVSYVSQESWIQNTTIQNNILFYHQFDSEKYNNIINLCEGKTDLDFLVGGDGTEIGEKGVNLSGGQKARISLARAMYTDKDIYILDDPISALDAHTGKNIMGNCIIGHLKDKTRILVTHALQYASYADRIIYMKEGEIKWSGNYKGLITQPFYQSFYEKMNNNNSAISSNKAAGKSFIEKTQNGGTAANKGATKTSMRGILKSNGVNHGGDIVKRITKDEGKEIGIIDKSVYIAYFTYIGGICMITFLFLSMGVWQGLRVGSDIWLGYWSEHQSKESNLQSFLIYAGVALSSTIFNYLRTYLITKGSLKCSVRLHNEMIKNGISAPINLFHDTIPKGQIFNRLSKDLPTVDTYTMFWLMTFTSFGSSFISAVIICSLYQPYCLFFLPLFTVVCWWLSRFYMNCSRELTRIEGILTSPGLNIINETLPGSTTIRAYNFEDIYMENFQSRVDEHFKVRMYGNGTYQWYLLLLNFLSFLFLAFLVAFTGIFKLSFTAKEIGIGLTYSIVLQEDLVQFLSSISNFENTMTKMERCLNYTKIICEHPQEVASDRTHSSWPTKGGVEFINYNVKYRPDTEIVLKDLNFKILPGEHGGIVGRTGSGKSTISLCLFRILEATSGKIIIDDVDISTLGGKKLRSNITIIPQDATIMDGTGKYNIDPLDAYTSEDIYGVMEKIGFTYIINNNHRGLLQNISENGSNGSIGEKQLICITRAILRKSKIVIMDEATASIDFKTEEIIQRAINDLLKDSTGITIAHRIKTVVNSDKILVLDNGRAIEFDTPQNLLRNTNSYFYDYYNKSLL